MAWKKSGKLGGKRLRPSHHRYSDFSVHGFWLSVKWFHENCPCPAPSLSSSFHFWAFPLNADPLLLPQYGFQIDPLDAPAGATTTQAVMFFLPPSHDFAPNVNVQIQPYSGDIKSYATLSKKQFDQFGFKVITKITQQTGNGPPNTLAPCRAPRCIGMRGRFPARARFIW